MFICTNGLSYLYKINSFLGHDRPNRLSFRLRLTAGMNPKKNILSASAKRPFADIETCRAPLGRCRGSVTALSRRMVSYLGLKSAIVSTFRVELILVLKVKLS